MRHFRLLVLLPALFSLAASPLWAAGGSSAPSATDSGVDAMPTMPARTPEQMAADHYNSGLRLRDKAWKLEEKADAATNAGQREKLLAKMQKQFEKAAEKFQKATELNPKLHQAWSSLGYALRRTGEFEASLRAYDQALTLAPHYAEAIEYRAEAYLGLGRLDDAKEAYVYLFSHDRPRADELLEAMREWVDERRQEPGELDAELVESFAAWVDERSEVAEQVADASAGTKASW